MKLPDKFIFTADDETYTYTATAVPDNCTWLVTWKEDDEDMNLVYSARNVSRHVRNGSWRILPESFSAITDMTASLDILINEKEDASELSYGELKALRLTRGLITRLLGDRN